jgi:SAM-dependent methyltransferase
MSEPFDSIEALAGHYAALLDQHRDGPRAVGWHSAHVQMASFAQLAAMDGMAPGARVLDVGCGLGAFKTFLDQRGLEVDYTGWDVCAPLIEAARQRHPGVRFDARDLLQAPGDERFDVVVCAGALNLRLRDHEDWAGRMLQAMFDRCRVGMGVSLLSACFAIDHPLHITPLRHYYAAPQEVLAWCLGLSRQVVLDHCELAQSFAVYVYRRNTAPMGRLAAAVAPGPRFGPGHGLVAELYESHGMTTDLIDYLSGLEPSAEVYDRIGMAAFQLGDEERQRDAFARAVALAPDGPAAVSPLVHLAITHMDSGHHAEAAPLLERACALSPRDAEVAYQLGRCRERQGLLEAARTAYGAALARASAHASDTTSGHASGHTAGHASDHAGARAALHRLDRQAEPT